MYWVRDMLRPYNVQVNLIIDKTDSVISAYTIGGFYDPSLDFGEKDIEMYLVFNNSETHCKFYFEETQTKVLIDEIFVTLTHEKRHRYQFKKRGKAYGPKYHSKITDEDLKNDLEYYGDPDEIDAYAQEAVIEERLQREVAIGTRAKYRELFANHDPKVYNRFLKKYYEYNNKIIL